jgi:aspartyl aminopeptidase
MENTVTELKAFLDRGHSVYHVAAALEKMLKQTGYHRLEENRHWELAPGGKYYWIRGGAVMAFRLPVGEPTGFLMSAAHADRPSFKIKENGELSGKYTRLATEKYGGMLISSWLDRPLSLAGRVLVEQEEGLQCRLIDIDRDLFLIPNVAIHMNRKANEGVAWNPAVDTLPLLGSGEASGTLQRILEEAAGGKLLGHDLFLYVRQQASVWGVEGEYISAQGLDDLACVWCCAKGFLDAEGGGAVPVLCVFDSEEVGSQSPQGADSAMLENLLNRICRTMGWESERLLSQSFMVSADNAHALHPNHPEYSDGTNAPVLNGGVVLKFNANQRYATDGVSAGLFRKICAAADVPVQTYYNRADLPGGSTLGSISVSHVTVPTVDIGIAQLAMHSCYETAGVKDADYLVRAMTAYYSSTPVFLSDGSCRVGADPQ